MIQMILMGLSVITMLLAGFPVALVLGLTGIAWTFFYSPTYLPGIAHTIFNTLSSDTLISIPLFILMGQIVQHARIARRFYEALARQLSGVPGGLLHANILACGVFSAVSGSSMATATTIAAAALPSQQKLGYDKRLSSGTLAAGGTLGILIPPSIPLIIYASLAEESVGALFLAALVPALVLMALFHAYIFARAVMSPAAAPIPDAKELPPLSLRQTLHDILPLTSIVAAVLGVIYTGWMTASEAAAGGVLAALLVAAATRALNGRTLLLSIVETTRLSSMLLFIVIGAQIFSYAVYAWGFNTIIGAQVSALPWPREAVLVVLVLIYLVLGMFVDAISLLLMSVPVVYPIIKLLGFDPVWFGVVVVLLLEIGLITPPVGMNLFVIKAISPGLALGEIAAGALPFVVILLAVIALLVAFPQLALWLPFH